LVKQFNISKVTMVDALIEQVRASVPKMVVVHPTVLLSVVDHYNRIAKDTKKRVVGVLLGEYGDKGILDVTNCYAVPFDEDPNEPNVWFFDPIYHETMFGMMRKINSKEKIIGWYSSGPAIKKADIDINEILRKYNTNPVFVLIKVHEAAAPGIPTEAYCTQEEVDDNGNPRNGFIKFINGNGYVTKNYTNGFEEGERLSYNAYGELISRELFKNGKLHGLSVYYIPRWKHKSCEGNYIDGKKEGEWKFYKWITNPELEGLDDPFEMKISKIEIYKNNQLVSSKDYSKPVG
jgi:proteasome lid subunit RPN8/RPN11